MEDPLSIRRCLVKLKRTLKLKSSQIAKKNSLGNLSKHFYIKILNPKWIQRFKNY
jgi:hypothetical protein